MYRRIALRAREISVPSERKVPAAGQMCPVSLRHRAVMHEARPEARVVRLVRAKYGAGPLFARRVALELFLARQVVPPGEFPLLLEEQLALVHRMLRPRHLAVHALLRDQPATIRVRVRGCARRNASGA